jgi:hypothetical protein
MEQSDYSDLLDKYISVEIVNQCTVCGVMAVGTNSRWHGLLWKCFAISLDYIKIYEPIAAFTL